MFSCIFNNLLYFKKYKISLAYILHHKKYFKVKHYNALVILLLHAIL